MKRKILLIFVALFMVFTLSSCAKEKNYEAKDYILTYEMDASKSELKILQLTDIHMGQMDDASIHYAFIKKTIEYAKPDFIIITGDVFTFATKKVAIDLFNFLDSFEIPWSITWGNHDEQCYFSIDWVTDYLNGLNEKRASGDSYCYFKDIQDDNVKGNANYVVQVKKNGEVFENLIIMDSNRYYFGEYMYYDYMDESQIEWYKNIINLNKNVKSLMFFHIPLPEFANYDDLEDSKYIAGEYNEDACSPDKNLGFYQVIEDLGSTEGIFVGHDHINDYIVKHNDKVYFTYGVKATNRVYYEDDMLGGTLITVKNSKLSSISQITFDTYDAATPEVETVEVR